MQGKSTAAIPASRSRWLVRALVVALAAPAAFIALSRLWWSRAAPEALAFHWDIRGRVDGVIPAEALFALALGGACVGLVMGLVALLVPRLDATSRRTYLFVTGSIAGISAAAWGVSAGLTVAAGTSADADLGGWIVLYPVGLLYGALPSALSRYREVSRPLGSSGQ